MKHFLMKFTGILAILLSFAFSSLASYCACCAEKGYYSISYGKPDDYQIAELESVVFAKRVSRYVDAGDDVMGISTVADTYDFAGSFAKLKWN